MQFKIELDKITDPKMKDMFAEYLYERIQDDLSRLVRSYRKKYEVREDKVLSSSLIKWKGKVPTHLDLPYYVENCLVLSYSYGTYSVEINSQWLIRGTLTPVKLLIRMLEYGTETVPPFPMIRRLFKWYSTNYLNLFTEFLEERLGDIII